jgi:hypothetical protein
VVGGINVNTHIPHRESRLTTEELLEVVFSLRSDPEFCIEDSSLIDTQAAR